MDFGRAIASIGSTPPPMSKFILLCTEERTGSHLLSQTMATTGVLGRPFEYFNTERMKVYHKDYPAHPKDQYAVARHLSTTENGVFSLKMHGETMQKMLPSVPLFSAQETFFVYLTREDVLGQAISLVKAKKTSVWHKRAGEKLSAYLNLAKSDDFDGDLILTTVRDMCFRRIRWESYFARNGIIPLRVTYESLVADPQNVVSQLAAYARINEEAIINTHPFFEDYRKVADDMSLIWREKFISKFSDLYKFD